jgi:hypothetical protein
MAKKYLKDNFFTTNPMKFQPATNKSCRKRAKTGGTSIA